MSAIAIKERIARGEVGKAVIIGAGAIGCEMAEALSDLWGMETTVVEIADQVLPGHSGCQSGAHGPKAHRGERVSPSFSMKPSRKSAPTVGESAVQVVTSQRTLDADLVITAVGVRPNSELAQASRPAGSPRGVRSWSTAGFKPRTRTSMPVATASKPCT